MTPHWLHDLALIMLALGAVTACAIAIDEIRRPQPMAIMNVVWPVCALFGTLIIGACYLAYGRPGAAGADNPPFAVSVGKSALHCGSGCTVGDIIAEWLAFLFPAIALAFGWQWLFAERIFAIWVFDFILAFGFGVAFQYYAIMPMRKLSVRDGLVAALKADALSLTAWQVGMYAFMAFVQFYLFRGNKLAVNSAEFWFMMQIAMICGFITSYPVNWWLIRAGIKEAM